MGVNCVSARTSGFFVYFFRKRENEIYFLGKEVGLENFLGSNGHIYLPLFSVGFLYVIRCFTELGSFWWRNC